MNFKSLEYFIAVVEHGSISHAAQHLYITQPALSKQIKIFEIEIGYKLFVRSPKGMILTEHGKHLYDDVQPILLDLKSKIHEYSTIKKIRFGLSPFLVAHYLPELEGDNRIPVELTETREECFEFINMLKTNKIDAAIIQDYPFHKGLSSKFMYEEEFQIVVPKGHRLTKEHTVKIEDCLKYPHVLPPEESHLYTNLKTIMKKKKIYPKKMISVPYSVLIEYVVKGYGVSYLPSYMIKNYHHENVEFVQLTDKALIRKLYLFANSKRMLNLVWDQLHQHSLKKYTDKWT